MPARHRVNAALAVVAALVAVGAGKDAVDGVKHARRVDVDQRAYLHWVSGHAASVKLDGRP